jgi:branched-chain amino acid transport system substrate-binding protein
MTLTCVEEKGMRLAPQWWTVLVAAVLGGLVGVTAVAAAGAQFLPVLSIREGALRFSGIPTNNGEIDYLTLLNERDGGINGVQLLWEECETVYDVARGVECYERLKGKGPTGAAAFLPTGTPLTNALLERATHDQIPLLAVGIGRPDAADGRVFPYVFTVPSTLWSQNTAMIRFIGQRVGGMDQLKGLKIVHVYNAGGGAPQTIPVLDTQAARYGFAVHHMGVQLPGLDQKATWLRVKVAQPDWVMLQAVGVMVSTALKEAAQVGFPRDRIVGNAASCTEQDVVPAGDAAIGFICAVFHGAGTHFPLIQDILKYVYARGKGLGPAGDIGTVYWSRGMLRTLLLTEAIRTAMRHFGN